MSIRLRLLAVELICCLAPIAAGATPGDSLPEPVVASGEQFTTTEVLTALSNERNLDIYHFARLGGAPQRSPRALIVASEREILDYDAAARLIDHVMAGVPVLLIMEPSHSSTVGGSQARPLTQLLGVRPHAPIVVLSKAESGVDFNIIDIAPPAEFASAVAAMLQAGHSYWAKHERGQVLAGSAMLAKEAGTEEAIAPKLRRTFNFIGLDGQVSADVEVTVFRHNTDEGDRKTVHIRSRNAFVPNETRLVDGTPIHYPSEISFPFQYRTSHVAHIGGQPITLVDYLPASYNPTDFSRAETVTREFSIGGTAGADFGQVPVGQKLDWAAKTPISANASYRYGNSKTLTYNYQDYDLFVQPHGGALDADRDGFYIGFPPAYPARALIWQAQVSNQLFNEHIRRLHKNFNGHNSGSLTKGLREEVITRTMKGTTTDSFSAWEVDANERDYLSIRVTQGIRMHEHIWTRKRSNLSSFGNSTGGPGLNKNVAFNFSIDLGSWHLEREVPVLLRTLAPNGGEECIRQSGNDVRLGRCDARNPLNMWRLSAAEQYINVASWRCLEYRPSNNTIQLEPCAVANAQRWIWRADRLQNGAAIDRNLELAGSGTLRLSDAAVNIIPANIFNSLDIPWSSYPGAPSLGDVIPNRNGASPVISPEWVGRYRATPVNQRWGLEVVTRSLGSG